MKPYKADESCPKCGSDDIHDRYHGKAYSLYASSGPDCQLDEPCRGHETNEHILRHCRRCSYEWYVGVIRKPRKTTNPGNAKSQEDE